MPEFIFHYTQNETQRITIEAPSVQEASNMTCCPESMGLGGFLVEKVTTTCPIGVYGGFQHHQFSLDQKFLVQFSLGWSSEEAITKMNLRQIIDMAAAFEEATYPCKVNLMDAYEHIITSPEVFLGFYSAWPIPEGWEEPPFGFPIGRFHDDETMGLDTK